METTVYKARPDGGVDWKLIQLKADVSADDALSSLAEALADGWFSTQDAAIAAAPVTDAAPVVTTDPVPARAPRSTKKK